MPSRHVKGGPSGPKRLPSVITGNLAAPSFRLKESTHTPVSPEPGNRVI